MRVSSNYEAAAKVLDVILERWTSQPKKYPYTRPDAVIPQTIIPHHIEKNPFTHACFYFYACIYMRGGIESYQAFFALIRMWYDHPMLFMPAIAANLQPESIRAILKKYIGWDSRQASIHWVENSKRLVSTWDGDPRNLLKGLRNYDEALRRLKNKRTKKELESSGDGGAGFMGFQPKMVSMFIYFCDWEGWLGERFLYPPPADFHNFRLALANGALSVTLAKWEENIRSTEILSLPWRELTMKYLEKTGIDPLDLADAIWLFSLVMCGNSPVTRVRSRDKAGLFVHASVDETWNIEGYAQQLLSSQRRRLQQTCLICPFLGTCKYGIPSNPYYRKGLLVLQERPRFEKYEPLLDKLDANPAKDLELNSEYQHLLELEAHPEIFSSTQKQSLAA